ncbi:unnamed protein product [Blumeria hordei]|uniref:Uncharacterized protein n=1 Tax=Blumeria hordei TaxID=2867405 RepID=A0A383UKE7_BLUHO|nr:unnamed protein product [Blumeria hordei]
MQFFSLSVFAMAAMSVLAQESKEKSDKGMGMGMGNGSMMGGGMRPTGASPRATGSPTKTNGTGNGTYAGGPIQATTTAGVTSLLSQSGGLVSIASLGVVFAVFM